MTRFCSICDDEIKGYALNIGFLFGIELLFMPRILDAGLNNISICALNTGWNWEMGLKGEKASNIG